MLDGFSFFTRSGPASDRETRSKNLAILGALLVAFLPHVRHLPFWLSLFCIVLWGWRALIDVKGLKPPSRLVQLPLVLGGAAAVLLTYGRILGHDSGVALFAAMLAIKPLEIRNQRDQSVTLFLAYFMTVTLALFHNNMVSVLAMILSCLMTTAVLGLVHVRSWKVFESLRFSVVLFLQAAPLAVICFLLFPRLPGSLWGVPAQGASAVSGLSDRMSPGAISRIVLSGETAFRVSFDGPAPEDEKMYWRAMVLWDFDGRTWTEGNNPPFPGRIASTADPFKYTITLEAHHRNLLMALDMPLQAPFGSKMASGRTIRSTKPVFKRVGYEMQSVLQYSFSNLGAKERQRALHIIHERNPRTSALATRWKETAKDSAQIVSMALEYLREQDFLYTLRPALLGAAPVDDFLFRTREGFCEHYASSFTWMMRAAGVPARVVVGYQGGTHNPSGDYYIVRQSEAHAWSEVWLPERGWTRVDPTSAVAPQRISDGLGSIAPEVETPPFFQGLENTGLFRGWQKIRLRLDALYHTWNRWVLYYDFNRQGSLLRQLGLGRNIWQAFSKVLLLGLGLFLVFMTVMAVILMRKDNRPKDPVLKEYQRFIRKLQKAGIGVKPSEGPQTLAQRIRSERKDMADEAGRVCALYARLRYGPVHESNELTELKKSVRTFAPRRMRKS